MKRLIVAAAVIELSACASMGHNSISQRSMAVEAGMSAQDVRQILGQPWRRSFKADNQAWQYEQIAGIGHCTYLTVWFQDEKVIGLTSADVPSVQACRFGTQQVDWGQVSKPTLNLNVKTNSSN